MLILTCHHLPRVSPVLQSLSDLSCAAYQMCTSSSQSREELPLELCYLQKLGMAWNDSAVSLRHVLSMYAVGLFLVDVSNRALNIPINLCDEGRQHRCLVFMQRCKRSASAQRLARWSWNGNSQKSSLRYAQNGALCLPCLQLICSLSGCLSKQACSEMHTHTHTHTCRANHYVGLTYIPSGYYSPGSHHVWPHTSIIISALCVFSTSGAGILIRPFKKQTSQSSVTPSLTANQLCCRCLRDLSQAAASLGLRTDQIQAFKPKINLFELFDWWKRIVCVSVCQGNQMERTRRPELKHMSTDARTHTRSGVGLMETVSAFAQTASVGLCE